MTDEPFTLESCPRRASRTTPTQAKETQGVLFSGLHLLPGQVDLFPVDGHEGTETNDNYTDNS